ncbi:cache domain-containing protein [Hydrogenimonas sp.]
MKKIFFAIIIAVSTAIIVLIFNLDEKREVNKKNIAYDNINKFLLHTLNSEKMQSLSLALAMSKNRAIADAILESDADKGYKILHETTESFIKHLNRKYIYTQIFGKGLTVFARSWDPHASGIPMAASREDLIDIINTRRPKATIDTTVPAGIKASAPIVYNGHIIGILEVTTLLDRVVARLRDYQIETIPVILPDLVFRGDLIANNPTVQGYRIAVSNFSRHLADILHSLDREDFEELIHTDYLVKDDLFFAAYPIRNDYGKLLGYFITIVSKENFENFAGKQQSLIKSIFTMESTKEDIYHYVNSKNENIFKEMSPEQILHFNATIEEKDRILFDKAAKEKLRNLSKEELIDLIVHNFHKNEKKGTIK